MFLKGVWFLIAGVLLLGHTPLLAESYLRVCKNGVVYYYFASREASQPGQGGGNIPKLRGEARIQEPASPHNLPSSLVKEPVQADPYVNLAAVGRAPGQRPVPQATSDGLPALKASQVKENMGPATRYLTRLLTKLGYRCRPLLLAFNANQGCADSQPEVASIQEPQVVAAPAYVNVLNFAHGRRFLARGQPGPGWPKASIPLYYSFPVAGPFTFRDTWNEPRGGGRFHRAADIFAAEGTPVYAVTAGAIQTLATFPEAGITLLMEGQDGRGYGYMHLQGYAAGLREGKAVRTGELIGYVGRTGVQNSAAHLHFQVYADQRLCKDELLNPYTFLVQLCRGVGVTDLYQRRIARLKKPEAKFNSIKVSRYPGPPALRQSSGQRRARNSATLLVHNF